MTLHRIGILSVHPQLSLFPIIRCCRIFLRPCRIIPVLGSHTHLFLFNCAVIWFIKWAHKIWGLLENLVKERLKVRTNAKIDNVRTFCISKWKTPCYFTISKHSSKQRLLVATGIQRIVILNYIEYLVNLSICYRFTMHKQWSFSLRISSVNVTKSAFSCGFGHIYWRKPHWKILFFVQCNLLKIPVMMSDLMAADLMADLFYLIGISLLCYQNLILFMNLVAAMTCF